MKPVRARAAVLAGAVCAGLTAIGMQLVVNSGESLPKHSWWELLLIVVVAGALVSAGWRIRGYVRKLTDADRGSEPALRSNRDTDAVPAAAGVLRGVEPPAPEAARRVLVFAQAAAVGGGALTGWYLGQIVVHVPRWNVSAVRSAVLLLAVLAVSAAVLSAAGYLVQKWCTIPEDQR